MSPLTSVVVPCFNEAARLDFEQLAELFVDRSVRLILVNDGSSDATGALIDEFASKQAGRCKALHLASNCGKAEAVRVGLLEAIADESEYVGYLDADLAAPPSEMLRLLKHLDASGATAALGSRVRLLGSNIQRSTGRHYLGRIFATVASSALRLPIYDTQCGAKLFRVSGQLRCALGRSFRSRWAFDVELLARLLEQGRNAAPPLRIVEVPLATWSDRSGSKLGATAMLRAGIDLGVLWARGRFLGRSRKPNVPV